MLHPKLFQLFWNKTTTFQTNPEKAYSEKDSTVGRFSLHAAFTNTQTQYLFREAAR